MISPRKFVLALALTTPLLSACSSREGEACRCADDCDKGLECVAAIGPVTSCLHPADPGGVCVEKGVRVVLPDDLGETGQLDDQIIDDWLNELDGGGESSGSSGATASSESGVGSESVSGGSTTGPDTSSDTTGNLESSETAGSSAGTTSDAGEAGTTDTEGTEPDDAGETLGETGSSDAGDESESSGW